MYLAINVVINIDTMVLKIWLVFFFSTIYIKHFLKQIVQLNITMTQSYETDVKGIQRVVNILSV